MVSGVVIGSGAIEYVLSDGLTSNTTVDSGGFEGVGIGGTAVGTAVSDGGYEAVSGGTTSDNTVHSGGSSWHGERRRGGRRHRGGQRRHRARVRRRHDQRYRAEQRRHGSTQFPARLDLACTAVDPPAAPRWTAGGGSTSSFSTTVSGGGTEIVDPGGNDSGTVVSTGGNLVEPTRAGSGGLVIDVDYDASVANAPAGFETTVNAAVAYLESQFSTPITITIDVGYGEVDGTKLTKSDLGESTDGGITVSYSDLRSALHIRARRTSDEIAAAAGLPATAILGVAADARILS